VRKAANYSTDRGGYPMPAEGRRACLPIHSCAPVPVKTARPGTLACWWLAIRPQTLTVAMAPVIVGSALAWSTQGSLHPASTALALLTAVLIQIGTNLHNDVGDFERGSDAPDRLGPPRATARGWLSAAAVRRGAWVAFFLAFICGTYLAWRGGWPIVAVGLASLLAGWAYTGGPRPIAYTALGELFVLLFFGYAAVAGSYYLQTLSLGPAVLLCGAMVGLFAAAVITVNNYRDRDTDARVGKKTLAVVVGRRAVKQVYAAEMLLPFVFLPWLATLLGWSVWFALPLLLLPWTVREIGLFWRLPPGSVFNEVLARTARLQLAYCVLLAAAIVARQL